MHWLLDFDDTLVLGPNTWAFQEVLPDLIRSNKLPYDKALFDEVTLKAQQKANEDISEEELLNELFATLQWPDELKSELVHRIYNGYEPHLFDDVIPFLEQIQATGHQIYLITNNNYAPQIAENIGIKAYFSAIVTPKQSGVRHKPHPDMWNVIQSEYKIEGETIMVGDDPWSDGIFAQQAGIPCWIVDRLARYTSLHEELPYRWVRSLSEIIET
jgi:HAD superfamily hydrolase (TIGR01549 family)